MGNSDPRFVTLQRSVWNSLHRQEFYAHGGPDVDLLASWRKFPAPLLDSEDDQIIGILIRRDQILAGRVNVEVSRRAAAGRRVAPAAKHARGVDGEPRDRVHAAVGAVDELT